MSGIDNLAMSVPPSKIQPLFNHIVRITGCKLLCNIPRPVRASQKWTQIYAGVWSNNTLQLWMTFTGSSHGE